MFNMPKKKVYRISNKEPKVNVRKQDMSYGKKVVVRSSFLKRGWPDGH